jgi:hypothetical protein
MRTQFRLPTIRVQHKKGVILTSSVKLTTRMFENMSMGSSIMSLDHTFKIMSRA